VSKAGYVTIAFYGSDQTVNGTGGCNLAREMNFQFGGAKSHPFFVPVGRF
jgi:hypothetical protein